MSNVFINKTTGLEILVVPSIRVYLEMSDDDNEREEGPFEWAMKWALKFKRKDSYKELSKQFQEYENMSLEDKSTITHKELSNLVDKTGMRGTLWSYSRTYYIYNRQSDGSWKEWR